VAPVRGGTQPVGMNSNAYMYILRCADGSFYVGSTIDLDRRLWQHQNREGASYTRRKSRQPVEVVYVEAYSSIFAAFCREKQVQGWGRDKRIALIEQRFDDLPDLAERYSTKQLRRLRESLAKDPDQPDGDGDRSS
jgi:putative endonuclease